MTSWSSSRLFLICSTQGASSSWIVSSTQALGTGRQLLLPGRSGLCGRRTSCPEIEPQQVEVSYIDYAITRKFGPIIIARIANA
jgi:hypothetical protein